MSKEVRPTPFRLGELAPSTFPRVAAAVKFNPATNSTGLLVSKKIPAPLERVRRDLANYTTVLSFSPSSSAKTISSFAFVAAGFCVPGCAVVRFDCRELRNVGRLGF